MMGTFESKKKFENHCVLKMTYNSICNTFDFNSGTIFLSEAEYSGSNVGDNVYPSGFDWIRRGLCVQ